MQAQNHGLSARLITFNNAVTSKGQLVIKKMQFPELDKSRARARVCVCVCVCVCVSAFTVKALTVWINWDDLLKTFLSYAKSLKCHFRIKHLTKLITLPCSQTRSRKSHDLN